MTLKNLLIVLFCLTFAAASAWGKPAKKRKSAKAPAGVATTLPSKRTTTNTSTMPQDETGYTAGGQTRSTASAVVVPSERGVHYNASADVSYGNVNAEDAHVAFSNVNVTRITPKLFAEFPDLFSAYLDVPFNFMSPDAYNSFSTIGRPELGVLKSLYIDKEWAVGAGLGVRLPFYSLSGGEDPVTHAPLFIDPMRVWQFAPGASAIYSVPDTTTKIEGALSVAYDTPATFNFTDPSGNTIDRLERPFHTKATLAATHRVNMLTLGFAFHTLNDLGSGRVMSGGQTLKDVPARNLSHLEAFGVYKISDKTTASASLTKGLNTSNDPSTFALYDDPLDIANFAATVGVAQNF